MNKIFSNIINSFKYEPENKYTFNLAPSNSTNEDNKIKPSLIIGTSMGALVGGMYAAGKTPQEMTNMASNFNSIGNFSLTAALFRGNLLNITKTEKILKENLGTKTFDSLNTKFVAVATNMQTGKQHLFDSGLVIDGVMASIAIPGMFPFVEVDGVKYCDGGVVNNLAEDVAKVLMPDAVIVSVDVLGNYADQIETLKLKTMENFVNTLTIMMTNQIASRPQCADVRISITQPETSQFDFTGKTAVETIKRGEEFALKYIKEIKKLLKN